MPPTPPGVDTQRVLNMTIRQVQQTHDAINIAIDRREPLVIAANAIQLLLVTREMHRAQCAHTNTQPTPIPGLDTPMEGTGLILSSGAARRPPAVTALDDGPKPEIPGGEDFDEDLLDMNPEDQEAIAPPAPMPVIGDLLILPPPADKIGGPWQLAVAELGAAPDTLEFNVQKKTFAGMSDVLHAAEARAKKDRCDVFQQDLSDLSDIPQIIQVASFRDPASASSS